MKESAVFDKPYIKKSAWVGAESFPLLCDACGEEFVIAHQPAFVDKWVADQQAH
jgi:hypothetical protein